uniref:LURP-one-related/scramblase family protein n=1 Tax=Ningiella ruwaisensis TaxID=2364274 RepID=UPI00109FFF97|nr:LURP-one-related family protein [Ningiella ruwaisensis]
MKYRIKQKFFSLSDSFNIEDAHGRTAFTAKGKIFSISSSQTMFDASGREILKIRRKYLSFRPACRIVNSDGSEWLIKKRWWPFWTTRFTIKTPKGELEMTGNLWQYEYEIRRRSELLATVSKALFSFSDSYGIDIYDESLTPQLIALVIVIDRMQHKDSGSMFADD